MVLKHLTTSKYKNFLRSVITNTFPLITNSFLIIGDMSDEIYFSFPRWEPNVVHPASAHEILQKMKMNFAVCQSVLLASPQSYTSAEILDSSALEKRKQLKHWNTVNTWNTWNNYIYWNLNLRSHQGASELNQSCKTCLPSPRRRWVNQGCLLETQRPEFSHCGNV